MADWKNEAEAREQIKQLVAEYYHDFKEKKEPFKPGGRISYASRVFDEKEMQALTDATLDFWLTTGRFADRFEKDFAAWIGVKYAHLVNSGSSANLIAFMALTAPELGRRQILPGDEVITTPMTFAASANCVRFCGATVVFEENEALSNCAFCGRSLVRAEYLDADGMPESVIPFGITEDEARDRLAAWCRENRGKSEAKKLNRDLENFHRLHE